MTMPLTDQTLLLLMLATVLVVRKTPLRYPFNWQETFWHELSHGLAAVITGGRIRRIHLMLNGGGKCVTQGGSQFIILLSGYLGAALWGGLIYLVGWSYSHAAANAGMWFLLAMFAVTALLWARDVATVSILVLMAVSVYLPMATGDVVWWPFFLQFTGLYIILSAIQAPLHLIDSSDHGDGGALARHYLLPEFFWIALWVAAASAVLWWVWGLNAPTLTLN